MTNWSITKTCTAVLTGAHLLVASGCSDDRGPGDAEAGASSGSSTGRTTMNAAESSTSGESSTGRATAESTGTTSTTADDGSSGSSGSSGSGGSEIGEQWPPGAVVNHVIYDGDRFIAVGGLRAPDAPIHSLADTLVLTSEDGLTWARVETPYSVELLSVAAGAHGYLAVGTDYDEFSNTATIALESVDGQTWTEVSTPDEVLDLHSVAYNGDRFVVLADANLEQLIIDKVALVWQDGASEWQSVTLGPLWSWRPKITVGKGTFIAYGNTAQIASSSDGLEWTVANDSAVSGVRWIGWQGDRFLGWAFQDCCGSPEWMWLESPTTQTWDVQPDAGVAWVHDIASSDTRHVAVTYTGISMAEGDLRSAQWTVAHGFAPREQFAWSVAYGEGRFVVGGVGEPLLMSEDALHWERVMSPLQ